MDTPDQRTEPEELEVDRWIEADQAAGQAAGETDAPVVMAEMPDGSKWPAEMMPSEEARTDPRFGAASSIARIIRNTVTGVHNTALRASMSVSRAIEVTSGAVAGSGTSKARTGLAALLPVAVIGVAGIAVAAAERYAPGISHNIGHVALSHTVAHTPGTETPIRVQDMAFVEHARGARSGQPANPADLFHQPRHSTTVRHALPAEVTSAIGGRIHFDKVKLGEGPDQYFPRIGITNPKEIAFIRQNPEWAALMRVGEHGGHSDVYNANLGIHGADPSIGFRHLELDTQTRHMIQQLHNQWLASHSHGNGDVVLDASIRPEISPAQAHLVSEIVSGHGLEILKNSRELVLPLPANEITQNGSHFVSIAMPPGISFNDQHTQISTAAQEHINSILNRHGFEISFHVHNGNLVSLDVERFNNGHGVDLQFPPGYRVSLAEGNRALSVILPGGKGTAHVSLPFDAINQRTGALSERAQQAIIHALGGKRYGLKVEINNGNIVNISDPRHHLAGGAARAAGKRNNIGFNSPDDNYSYYTPQPRRGFFALYNLLVRDPAMVLTALPVGGTILAAVGIPSIFIGIRARQRARHNKEHKEEHVKKVSVRRAQSVLLNGSKTSENALKFMKDRAHEISGNGFAGSVKSQKAINYLMEALLPVLGLDPHNLDPEEAPKRMEKFFKGIGVSLTDLHMNQSNHMNTPTYKFNELSIVVDDSTVDPKLVIRGADGTIVRFVAQVGEHFAGLPYRKDFLGNPETVGAMRNLAEPGAPPNRGLILRYRNAYNARNATEMALYGPQLKSEVDKILYNLSSAAPNDTAKQNLAKIMGLGNLKWVHHPDPGFYQRKIHPNMIEEAALAERLVAWRG